MYVGNGRVVLDIRQEMRRALKGLTVEQIGSLVLFAVEYTEIKDRTAWRAGRFVPDPRRTRQFRALERVVAHGKRHASAQLAATCERVAG